MSANLANEIGVAGLKVAPPLAVAAGSALGSIDPQWVIAIPTAIYVVLQTAYLLWKWRKERKAKRGE